LNTKELIGILQSLDPEGETEVVFNNVPITWVNMEPGFYDGCFFKFINLDSDDVQIKVCGWELKVSLSTQGDLIDTVHNNPHLQVYYDGDYSYNSWDKEIEEMRIEGLEFEFEAKQNVRKD